MAITAPTLDKILTKQLFSEEIGGDEIVACDPRNTPRRRGTVVARSGNRLWVEWFHTDRHTWIDASRVYYWKDCNDPIPRRGYVMQANESCIRAAEAS
jgi:hypothetical protein